MTKKSAQPAGDSPPKPKQAAKPAQKPGNEQKRPRGRQTIYSTEIADEILRRLSTGETLMDICRDEHMPAWRTVYDWKDAHPDFDAGFARARDVGADAIAEGTLAIIDEKPERIMTEHGDKVDPGFVAWQKARVEQRLKLLAKWSPKKYGDKLDVNHGVQPDNPLASVIQRIAGTGLPIVPEAKEE